MTRGSQNQILSARSGQDGYTCIKRKPIKKETPLKKD
jgi:hypothetical protein